MDNHVICQRCNTIDQFHIEYSGPHIKAICDNCERYIKFLPHSFLNGAGNVHPVDNKMSTLISASVCLTDLVEKAKAGHSAFTRGKNGKVYTNLTIWLNDDPDQFGNHLSIQLNSAKDKKEAEGKTYVGNGKVMLSGGEPVKAGEVAKETDISNLPF